MLIKRSRKRWGKKQQNVQLNTQPATRFGNTPTYKSDKGEFHLKVFTRALQLGLGRHGSARERFHWP